MYHLGDFGNADIAKNLNGQIILLLGNYEKDIKELENNKKILNNNKFKDIIDKCNFELMIPNNDNVVLLNLVHEPSNMINKCFNLYGHVHQLSMVKKTIDNKMGLNVGTDCHEFYPVDLETILFYKNAVENFYDDEVFM